MLQILNTELIPADKADTVMLINVIALIIIVFVSMLVQDKSRIAMIICVIGALICCTVILGISGRKERERRHKAIIIVNMDMDEITEAHIIGDYGDGCFYLYDKEEASDGKAR